MGIGVSWWKHLPGIINQIIYIESCSNKNWDKIKTKNQLIIHPTTHIPPGLVSYEPFHASNVSVYIQLTSNDNKSRMA